MARTRRLFALHGFAGGLKIGAKKLYQSLFWFTPAQRRAEALMRERSLEFDRRWGIDTSGTILPPASEVVGSNWVHGVKYLGCNSTALEQLLGELSIPYAEFTFMDFGSGKGRAVLTAARFPFKRVIGVEYCEQLNEVARQNAARFPESEKRCGALEIVCADAAKFPIPPGPLILFLFNPFGESVMKEVVRNVRTSYQGNPRRVLVLYFHGLFADLWKDAGFLTETRTSEWVRVYDSHPGS